MLLLSLLNMNDFKFLKYFETGHLMKLSYYFWSSYVENNIVYN
jgi:hypothetical protein